MGVSINFSFVIIIVLIPFCQSFIFLPYIFFWVEGFEFVGVALVLVDITDVNINCLQKK